MLREELKSGKCDKLGLCLRSEPSGSSAAGCVWKEESGFEREAAGLGRELRSGAAQPSPSLGGQMASAAF